MKPPEFLKQTNELVEPALKAVVERLSPEISLPASYHFGWVDESGNPTTGRGKGIRPALAILSGQYVGADADMAVPGAVAVELVHNFSLIHDDIIDKDAERRHRLTIWKLFGLEDALLVGDALLVSAFQVLLEAKPQSQNLKLAAAELAQATSAMIAGQRQDMKIDDFVSLEMCQVMESQKTGALLSCSASIGAILAGGHEEQIAALRTYGMELGLAFQAVDDLLGIWGDPEVTGKPAGNDIEENKRSLPIVLALQNEKHREFLLKELGKENKSASTIAAIVEILDELEVRQATQEIANQHLKLAVSVIDEQKNSIGNKLKELAEFVTSRDF